MSDCPGPVKPSPETFRPGFLASGCLGGTYPAGAPGAPVSSATLILPQVDWVFNGIGLLWEVLVALGSSGCLSCLLAPSGASYDCL